MQLFTPLSAAIGGALIGVSASLLWIALGRIAGISLETFRLLAAPTWTGELLSWSG